MIGLGKPLRKIPIQKIEKEVKIKEKLPHVYKNHNRISVQTPFSHSTSPLAFSLHFLFRRDQNHYSNLTSKIMKM